MKNHAKKKNEIMVEAFTGLMYFLIIFYSLFTKISYNNLFFYTSITVYFISITITYLGYITYLTTPKGTLITKFPFSISRNPTYFFGLIAITAISIQTKCIILFTFVLIQFYFTHKIVLTEEKFCKKTYKKEFENYARRVRRYI